MSRVAVIGSGYWGRNLVRNFHALGALSGICDTDKAALSEQAALYPDVEMYADIDALFRNAAIDSVAIATPAATHGTIVREALASGKHVFVEKPLCLDIEEAADLRVLANEKGRTLMVGHLLLYHPAFRALQNFVDEGHVGRLRYIYSNRASLGKIRKEENALWSFAPHDISMILSLTRAMPRRVVCNGGTYLHPSVADTSLTHLSFSEGLQAHIFVSWLHPFKDHRLVVVGSEGMAVFNDVADGENKLLAFDHKIGWTDNLPTIERAEAKPIPYDIDEPLYLECKHFLECIDKNRQPKSDADEAIRVLTILDACQNSLSSKSAVEF
jgi:UDP-2-acetamido-3-amino-2,3-dideoxy-glucuronate N-acetyltransferase